MIIKLNIVIIITIIVNAQVNSNIKNSKDCAPNLLFKVTYIGKDSNNSNSKNSVTSNVDKNLSINTKPCIDISNKKFYLPTILSSKTIDNNKTPCIQKIIDYDNGYSKTILAKQWKKWKKNNTKTYVYLDSKSKNIIFIKNNNIEYIVYFVCKNGSRCLIHNTPYRYKLQKFKKYSLGSTINKVELIDDIFKKAKNRDISKKNYCKWPLWKISYNKKYGFITKIVEKDPKCKCLPNKIGSHIAYKNEALLMLPKETIFIQNNIDKIVDIYNKIEDCKVDIISSNIKNDNKKNKIKSCYDKYLVWKSNKKSTSK